MFVCRRAGYFFLQWVELGNYTFSCCLRVTKYLRSINIRSSLLSPASIIAKMFWSPVDGTGAERLRWASPPYVRLIFYVLSSSQYESALLSKDQ